MTLAAAAGGIWPFAALWAVFVVGLTGGLGHCVGMCGPFVSAAGFAQGATGERSAGSVAAFQALYHAGRIGTYSALGAVLGAAGGAGTLRGLLAPGWITSVQSYLHLASGILMMVMGAAVLGAPLLGRLGRSLEGGGVAGSPWFSRATGFLTRAGLPAALPLGLLMGLLPCGFLLSIEARALASGSALAGAATMFAFGLGTVPALAGFGAASGLLGSRARTVLLWVGGALVLGLGAATAWQAAVVLASATAS